MEMTKLDQGFTKQVADEVTSQMRDLSDLQLALVGGGIGEVIVA